MPNRILREGILTSERVASLDWASEVFYRRLHSIVDDYGRHEAGTQLLRAKCYPLQTDQVRVADIARWMAACQKAGVILVYGANGKQYLEVCNFEQRQRSDSKCPPPPTSASNCAQMSANDGLGVCVFEGVCEGDSASRPNGDAQPAEPAFIELPLNDGSEYPITESQVLEFSGLYPAVDVRQSLRGMRAWCVTNPAKRKTRHGVMRFVNTWLAKEQDAPKAQADTATAGTPRKRRELGT